jgi:hypothetical protein
VLVTLKNRVELLEEDSKILESLAREHGESSREYAALKRAAIALWYVLAEDHHKFRDYVARFEGELTPEQKAHLTSMGIDAGAPLDDSEESE